MTIEKFRLFFLCFSWFSGTLNVIFGETFSIFSNVGALSILIFFILTFSHLKKESFYVIIILFIIALLILDRVPSIDEFLSGGRFILIFSSLLPTMILVRSVSKKLKSIKTTQTLLNNMPVHSSTSGFQIVSHVFGSIINTGTFAILSSAIPNECKKDCRKKIAEACLRGMNTSATWSPFFVAFAVGQIFIDKTNSWIAIFCGILIGIIFNLISLPIFSQSLDLQQIKSSLFCLKPVSKILFLVMFSILSFSIVFDFTALSAVVLVMPSLVIIYLFFNKKIISEVYFDTKSWLIKTSDDIVVISFAMFIGYLINLSNSINDFNLFFYSLIFPSWSLLILTPLIITIFSFIGIHPIISSTIALPFLTSFPTDIHPALIMQAHLVGWAGGTMSSITSLSVLTCSNLFQISSNQLAFGPNLLIAIFFAISSGLILCCLNFFM